MASCAQGGTNGELFFARSGAGEQEIRDVCAGNEEHQRNGAEKHEEANAHFSDHAIL